jgi:hypothetical protein
MKRLNNLYTKVMAYRLSGRENTAGSIPLLGVLGLAVMLLIIKYKELYFAGVNPVLFMAIVALLYTIAFFSIGCAIHLKAMGARPSTQLLKDMRDTLARDEHLIISTNSRIRDLERRMMSKSMIMTSRGTDCLGLLKRIIRALEKRTLEAKELVSSGYKIDLIDAYELLSRKLVISESALDSLIDAEPFPPVDNAELVQVIERLLVEVEFEVKKIA